MTGDLPESFTALSSMANMYLQNNQFTGSIDVLSNLPLHNLREGNSWSSGPAPPPLPRTPPSSSSNRNRKQNDNKNSSDGGGSKKSGIGGGGVAGIVISILVVGAVVAFFAVIKKRSKRSSTDVEKADSQPFTSYASQEVQGTNLLHPIEKTCLTSFFN
uniref:Malectin-like domain-containing protein n=1 Tax=Daucus carota subsp. sativus TaxID=79200 RepID=A0A166H4X8_DAUCS